MYEKVTQKLVDELTGPRQGYEVLNSLISRYICKERRDLLPDLKADSGDLEITCLPGHFGLRLAEDKYSFVENKNVFTFNVKGVFFQSENVYPEMAPNIYDYWRELERVRLDDVMQPLNEMYSQKKDLLERLKSDETEIQWEEEYLLASEPDEGTQEGLRKQLRELEDAIKKQMGYIEARSKDFKLYLNISFEIDKDNHHINFDDIYISHTKDGRYILGEDKEILYREKLASHFSYNILRADLNDVVRKNSVCVTLQRWLSIEGEGLAALNSLISAYICNERPDLLPKPDGFEEIQCLGHYLEFSLVREPDFSNLNLKKSNKYYYSFQLEGPFCQTIQLFNQPPMTYSELIRRARGRLLQDITMPGFDYGAEQENLSEEEINAIINEHTGWFSNIILNISFTMEADKQHILFDEMYLSHPGQEGEYIIKDGKKLYSKELRPLFPMDEAADRILRGSLVDELDAVVSRCLSSYFIKDEEKVFSRLFRFIESTQSSRRDEAEQARFNLLIKINHETRVMKLLYEMVKELNIFDPDKCRYVTEADLSDQLIDMGGYITQEGYRHYKDVIVEWFKKNELIVIYDCHMKPIPDGSKDREREILIYELTWKCIGEAAKHPKVARLIVVANDEVYRKTFKLNREIYDRVCNHHIEIPDLKPEEVYEMCLRRMQESSFGQFSEEAEEKLKKWFFEVYSRSSAKEEDFIDDLFNNRIFADFFSTIRDRELITPDLIPEEGILQSEKDIFAELDELVGLDDVKEEFRRMYETRVALGPGHREPEHMIFAGNPGTGKTTVAQKMADLLCRMQLIRTNNLVSVKALELTSRYQGGTTEVATEQIKKAYGGVLFIDEAYGLAQKEGSYAHEALDVLIQEMEDHNNPDRPVVILAGYETEMHDLLAANPGLESRIRRKFHFKDYNADQLLHILCNMLEAKGFQFGMKEKDLKKLKENGFKIENLPKEYSNLRMLINNRKANEFFGNAREMDTLCGTLIEQWAKDAYAEKEKNQKNLPKVITAQHIEMLLEDTVKVKDGFGDLVGLKDLKAKLTEFEKSVKYIADLKRNEISVPAANMHMIFSGNPGTGKTTVARIMADKLAKIHVLSTNKCVSVEAKDLLRYTPGKGPAQITESYIKQAKGGILFVDEAYTLVRNEAGIEAIEVLLTAMEEHKEDTIFIFAGYPEHMSVFLETNPGLASRISNRFDFPDYEPDELIEILYRLMKNTDIKNRSEEGKDNAEPSGLRFDNDEAVIAKLLDIMKMVSSVPNFGNGRFVEKLFRLITDNRANKRKYTGDRDDLRTLTVDDIPEIPDILKILFGITYEGAEKYKKRVAVHELGHAVVSLATDGDTDIERISVKPDVGSYGRVSYNIEGNILPAEQKYKNELASLLGGRNAERVFFGDNSAGCSNDYWRAKKLAQAMIEDWAMAELGITTPMELLREADARTTKILYDNREFIDEVADKLVETEEITGDEIKTLYEAYKKENGLKDLKAGLRKIKAVEQKDAKQIKAYLMNAGLISKSSSKKN